MIEQECLNAMQSFIATQLTNPAANIGTTEPITAADLPAVVLSLERVQRLGSGLGERTSTVTDGALRWTVTIELDHPVLPEEPTFQLLSPDRRTLILPHGGLVGADAGIHPLGPADLTVTVAGTARTVVNTSPTATQVRCDPAEGRLEFGAPLSAAGSAVVTYFIGQWEQRVGRLAGALRVMVRGATAGVTETLSQRILQAFELGANGALPGLRRLAVAELGAVGRPDAQLANARSRALVFDFEFELILNQPESSGGIIRRIPVVAQLSPSS